MGRTLRDIIAEHEFNRWRDWMKLIFIRGYFRNIELDGTVQCCWIMPSSVREYLEHQMNTPYSQLSDEEKEIDLADADKVLDILSAFVAVMNDAEEESE
jgi:hypothetical protein